MSISRHDCGSSIITPSTEMPIPRFLGDEVVKQVGQIGHLQPLRPSIRRRQPQFRQAFSNSVRSATPAERGRAPQPDKFPGGFRSWNHFFFADAANPLRR